MDTALELISVRAVAPGASATFAPVTGDSLTVRDSKRARLISIWSGRNSVGFFQLKSPLLHDAVVGIQQRTLTGTTIMRLGVPQELTPQDQLNAEGGGSAVAGDVELTSFLIFYEELAGICANLITAEECRKRAIELYSPKSTVIGDTSGNYSGSRLLSADEDQLKANQDYAILGATKTGAGGAVSLGYISPDWGNLRVGIPSLNSVNRDMSTFFYDLSVAMDLPLIPVFNASQKSSVFIDALNDQVSATVNVITQMVHLGTKVSTGRAAKRKRK